MLVSIDKELIEIKKNDLEKYLHRIKMYFFYFSFFGVFKTIRSKYQ